MQAESPDGLAQAQSALPRKAAIEAQDMVRRFGTLEAISHVSLSIPEGEFFSLLGPSGCGKTTLLRLIAGLDVPDEGRLKIGGRDMADVPAYQRPVHTVFQSYALFPHMTVRDNVAFGLRMKMVPQREVVERTRRIMELAHISDLADRRPAQLSGGEKQRVALARAVVNEPEVLLLDEPLGALDLKLRQQLQVELRQLQRRLGITFIYVTHDQDEALALSDRIAVMRTGRIEQMGTGEDLYERPRTRFVAQFVGTCNLLGGRVVAVGQTELRVETPLGNLCATTSGANRSFSLTDEITLAIRPEKVRLTGPLDRSSPDQTVATIEQTTYSGAESQYLLRCGALTLKATALNIQSRQRPYAPGDSVGVHFDPASVVVLED